MTTQTSTQINGVNVDQLVATVNAIKQNPDLARFQFRAHNKWIGGGHSRTSIQGFYGAGQEDASRSWPFILEGDEPPVLLGGNTGANAVEAVLHALASCLAGGFIYNAAAQGIHVESLDFDLEGDLDLGLPGAIGRSVPGLGRYSFDLPGEKRCATREDRGAVRLRPEDFPGPGHPPQPGSVDCLAKGLRSNPSPAWVTLSAWGIATG